MEHGLSDASAAPGRTERRPLLIGWKEFIEFPEWHVRRVKVKIDTGARTSALDANRYELVETPTGLIARLRLALDRKHPERTRAVEVPVLRMVVVTNSTGGREERPLIETTIRLGPVEKRIQLTVTHRTSMLFRMILGRQALLDDFVVDVSKKYLLKGQ